MWLEFRRVLFRSVILRKKNGTKRSKQNKLVKSVTYSQILRKHGSVNFINANFSGHIKDATCHAEIVAIQDACKKLGTNRHWGMDLYVTLEPCTMCAAAISFARIENLYFGAQDAKGGGVISGVKFYDAKTCHHKPKVHYGILEEDCSNILKDFFANKRKHKKTL